MLKVGLTGGIGSGKTTVANVFKTLGIPVFNADDAAKQIMEEDAELVASIKKEFGNEAYENEKLNRKYIANIVFKDTHKLEFLNALVHPVAIAKGLQWAAQQQSLYIIKEAALMFEAGSAFNLDYVIGVFAPQNIRIQRVMQRDNITAQEVLARMNNQIDDVIKLKLCDFTLVNDGEQMLLPQIIHIHNQLLSLSNSN